jgi:hypothetical protein
MLYGLASLVLLGAMAAFGVGLLRRVAPFLDSLERVAYGSALGVVLCSLALLVLGTLLGLSPLLVLFVGAAAAVGAFVLLARSGPDGAWSRPRIGLVAMLVLGVLVLRLALFWAGVVGVEEDGMWIAQSKLWADWAHHLGDVCSFAYGDNFPPQQFRFVGAPFAYHYLTSITAAGMVLLGMSPWSALTLHSFVFSAVIVVGLFAFARRFIRGRDAAALAVLLFLVGGGLGWTLTMGDALGPDGPVRVLLERPWDRGLQSDGNFRWLNVFFTSVAPQRAYLYGIPLFGLIMTLLLQALRTGAARWFAIAGAVAGLLPFAHLGAMLSLAIVTPVMFLQFPRRGWIWFYSLWVAIGLPQVLLQQGGTAGALSAFRWAPGWVAAPDPWLWFWLKNLGCFLPLLIVALGATALVERTPRRMLWSFMSLFVVANLFVFQPWAWDNTKTLVYWYLAGCLLVSALLVWIWRRFRGVLARGAIVLVVSTMLLSGALEHFHQLLGLDRNRLLTADELRVATLVREKTSPRAVFLTGQQHNHPIHVLAGRRVVVGYPGWLWVQGYDYKQRQQDVKSIYIMSPEAERLLENYGVDFIVIGPWERDHLEADPDAFRSRYPAVIETETYEIFRTEPLMGSGRRRCGGTSATAEDRRRTRSR